MKNKASVGKALGRVPSGLFIVTARHGDEEDGVLASWVNQCAFDPPAVTVALGKTRAARLLIEASETFIVNVIGKEGDLLKQFTGSKKNDVFDGVKTKKSAKGPRILSDAVSYLECRLISFAPAGDHVVYIGEIVGGAMAKGGEPYVHVRKNGFNY
ncbi:MAG: flavin reductase family protein [Candidatus Nitrohelix vancouverensis]|uniref:Flavin reductase family protein n=1 Tax=Candidatus Nitrohelix vancouverensis TaxID=2705534 RepID=A0A7T0G4K8_9BACT|nr:MAG: flavin reductase family protein [Candidatus Nitrohelix vancouverensis]